MPYTGWVTDSECGAAGATASHSREHVDQVLSRGGELQFYSEADQKLYPIADPVAAIEFVLDHIEQLSMQPLHEVESFEISIAD